MRIMHITSEGTKIENIESLEKLADYSLKEIAVAPFIPFGGQPITIIFEKDSNDVYKIGKGVYKELKHQYLESQKRNNQIDSLVKLVDENLRNIKPHKENTFKKYQIS